MTAFPILSPDLLDPVQRGLWDAITLGPRGFYAGGAEATRLPDLYNAWLHFPALGHAMLQLADAIRAADRLDGRSRELIILLVSARMGSMVEFDFHAPMARDQGIGDDMIAALRAKERPVFAALRDGLVYDAVVELLERATLPPAMRDAFVDVFGHEGLMQLIAAMGLYVVVSLTSNVADVRLADDFDADPARLADFYAGRGAGRGAGRDKG